MKTILIIIGIALVVLLALMGYTCIISAATRSARWKHGSVREMQEEINHKMITVYFKGAKVTANSLKAALRAVLSAREKRKPAAGHDAENGVLRFL